MANLKPAKDESEIKKILVGQLRKEYLALAENYNKMLNGDFIRCTECGLFIADTSFYSADNAIGVFPVCKSCLQMEVEQRRTKNDPPHETKKSVQAVLQKMNLPYIDSVYENACKTVGDATNEKNRRTPWLHYITIIKSLPNYRGWTWENSEFEIGSSYSDVTDRDYRPEMKTIFGNGFSNEDYLYLQDQFDDWRSRTQVDSKSQETYIVQICFKQLEIWKAQRQGRDTTSLIKSLNDLMNAANLQPKQNVGNAATDSLTFSQLLEKWEQEQPVSEPDPEFRDVDHIWHYLLMWFGWLTKVFGISNSYTEFYEQEREKYTVHKPEYREEQHSDNVYSQLFGRGD